MNKAVRLEKKNYLNWYMTYLPTYLICDVPTPHFLDLYYLFILYLKTPNFPKFKGKQSIII